MTASARIAIAACAFVGSIVAAVEYRSRSSVVTAGFWFDDAVTFELHEPGRTFAPPGTPPADVVDGIGRGVGRAAVHEFAHQILPNGPMHISRDQASYEFGSAARRAQYFGEFRWSVAREALTARLGR